ncbi:MAG: GNAT family N-acetyltransferase [Bacilli bacterium]|nr:GNAT family N-acetyltransferase [Bacilli bacterium]
MEIIEYREEYKEDCKDLLVELEEYIVSIDEDNLDQVGEHYREKMLDNDLEEINKNSGKCFIAIDNNKAIGLIMGCLRKWEESDYLDYKCPKTGKITELIVTNKTRSNGVGKELMKYMESYLKGLGCKYITIEVFAYNDSAKNFYKNRGYHSRMIDLIKKVDDNNE